MGVCVRVRARALCTVYRGPKSIKFYNPPSYSIGRHVFFLSGILSVLSGGTIILLTLVTMNIIYITEFFDR